jgi:hypothetical protein
LHKLQLKSGLQINVAAFLEDSQHGKRDRNHEPGFENRSTQAIKHVFCANPAST